VTGPDPRAGQEAARLLAVAQDWLRTSAPHLAPVAPDGEPCSCPLCRAVAGLREADPESVGRWVDSAVTALGSLVAQAGDLAGARTPGEPGRDAAPADAADRGSGSWGYAEPADASDGSTGSRGSGGPANASEEATGSSGDAESADVSDEETGSRGSAGPADAAYADSRRDDGTDDQRSGQDGPRPRRVRRIPLTREGGTGSAMS
jgi:hypothetical protein